ncbi:MAG TPA: hypothetical protein VJM12_21575 [Pyrinomonadaceae bacterium]|nr:hypothetical protein [Pyrinomonadaceae bacterium]
MQSNVNLSTPLGPLVFLGTFATGYEIYVLYTLVLDLGLIALLAASLLLLISTTIIIYTVIKEQLANCKLVVSAAAILVSMYIGAALFISFIAR